MFESEETQRRIGRVAWVMAWFGLVAGQLHALSRFATADGKQDLTLPLTRAWAVPAADGLRPLLDWGDPDLVYVTYGKIWLPVFLAFTLCALVVRRRRNPAGLEKWAWRIALVGYAWACLGVLGDYWTQWTGAPNRLLGISFVLGLPAVLLVLVGSSLLGIALLRNGPVTLPACLLAVTLPFAFAITQVTSMGSIALPIMFAFGILGRRIAREHTHVSVAATDPAPSTLRS